MKKAARKFVLMVSGNEELKIKPKTRKAQHRKGRRATRLVLKELLREGIELKEN